MIRAEFSDKQLADMVIKLTGEIEPVGDSYTDNKRYTNLLKVQSVVDILLDEICFVCEYSDRCEYSMKRAGEQAVRWLKETQERLNGYFDGEEDDT